MLSTKIRRLERVIGSVIIARRCRRKIKRVSRDLPITEDRGMKALIRARFPGYTSDLWHKAYAAASGVSTPDYVPEDLFYNVVESRLNPRHRREYYKDKNVYDRLNWDCLPATVFRIVNGRLYNKDYRSIAIEKALELARETKCPEFVVKPTRETGGGARVGFMDIVALDDFLRANMKPHADWIIQQPLLQHEAMADFNASSVNTVRIVTIRMGTEISFVSAFARLGTKGMRVDNLTVGNVAIGVAEDGQLAKYGYDIKLRRCLTHPGHGYAFEGLVIPSFKEARLKCIDLHETIPDLDLLSWDIAIDRNGAPVVIEFNIGRQDISLGQVCCGPVLNPYIDQILGRHKWMVIPGIGAIDSAADMAPEYTR